MRSVEFAQHHLYELHQAIAIERLESLGRVLGLDPVPITVAESIIVPGVAHHAPAQIEDGLRFAWNRELLDRIEAVRVGRAADHGGRSATSDANQLVTGLKPGRIRNGGRGQQGWLQVLWDLNRIDTTLAGNGGRERKLLAIRREDK